MTPAAATVPERVLSAGAPADPAARPLRHLFGLIQRADSVDVLRTSLISAAAKHFAAKRAALFLFSEMPPDAIRPETRNNPVARYLFERHAAVHEAVVMTPERWSAYSPGNDHGHVLSAPIVHGGEIIGVLALTRMRDDPAFDAGDLADASALCFHLCAWFARWNEPQATGWPLTPRERQITDLVARGLTNAQIGANLGISSETVKAALKGIFRKTAVTSRAALAAQAKL